MSKTRANNINIRGEGCPSHKLTAEKVKEIRELRKSGMKIADIARQFGVANGSIGNIISGKTWGWLE